MVGRHEVHYQATCSADQLEDTLTAPGATEADHDPAPCSRRAARGQGHATLIVSPTALGGRLRIQLSQDPQDMSWSPLALRSRPNTPHQR